MSTTPGNNTPNIEDITARVEGGVLLSIPQQSQGMSHIQQQVLVLILIYLIASTSSTSTRSNVDSTNTVPSRGRQPRAPSRLQRSVSLNSLSDEDDNESQESVHSLPQPVTNINHDSHANGRGRSFLHPRMTFENAPASLTSVRHGVYCPSMISGNGL